MPRKERKKREPRKTVIHPYWNLSEVKAILFNQLRAAGLNARLDIRTKGGKVDMVIMSSFDTTDPKDIVVAISVKPTQWAYKDKMEWLQSTKTANKYKALHSRVLICTSVHDVPDTLDQVNQFMREWG